MKKKSLRKILQNTKRKNAGITLTALVITIVVLVILATITINFAFGENGLVSMTEDARDITTEATEKEGIEMAVVDSKIKDITTPDREKENLEESLRSQFGNDANFTVTENGNGSFLINMNDSQRSYYVESTGEIIAQSEMIEIGTAEELKAFRDEVNSGNTFEGKYIRLTNNITLDSSEEWEPIGLLTQDIDLSIDKLNKEENKPFSGIFDGQGYTIDNVYINTSDICQGIFGLVFDGKIKNVNLGKNSEINTEVEESVGGIVGYMYGSGEIYNCKNYANIAVRGGIVGHIVGGVKVSNCINYGNLDNGMGGIVGSSNGGNGSNNTISNCGNYGTINRVTGAYAGGIVGYFKGNIYSSFNKGNIISDDKVVGGIVGQVDGNIISCYNVADIIGDNNVGGISGNISSGNIINSYSIANLTGDYSVGTFYGYSPSTKIENCYSKKDEFNAESLGSAFKDDYEEENINDGYPILGWQ